MKRLILERFCEDEKVGTFGRVYDDGEFVCYTVEQPWRDNKPFASCVPVGDYKLIPYKSPKYGDTFALLNHHLDVGVYQGEAKRYGCLLHSANTNVQLQGCIAPGMGLGMVTSLWAVTRSKDAMEKLLSRIEHDTWLTIIWKDFPHGH